MTETELQERREEIRREVRGYLASRPGLAFHPRTIQLRLRNYALEDVEAALAFLVSAGQERDKLVSAPVL